MLRLSSMRKMNFRVKVNSKVTFHLTMTVPKKFQQLGRPLQPIGLVEKVRHYFKKNSFRNNNKQHCY